MKAAGGWWFQNRTTDVRGLVPYPAGMELDFLYLGSWMLIGAFEVSGQYSRDWFRRTPFSGGTGL
jgi:hypothetical protein